MAIAAELRLTSASSMFRSVTLAAPSIVTSLPSPGMRTATSFEVGVIPGGSWAAPLFVIGPRGGPAGGFKGDDFGFVSFSPPAARRLERLRRQGATVDRLTEPKLIGPAGRAILTAAVLLMGTAIGGCALALTGVTLVIDMLILAPLVLAIHGLLR